MNNYRCFVLNNEGRISSYHDVQADTDMDAVLKAEAIAELTNEFPEIDVWSNAHLIARLVRPRQ